MKLPGKVLAKDIDEHVEELRLVRVKDLFDAEGKLIYEDPENIQEHSEAELDRLANSISRHGMLDAIALNANTGQIVGGHGRAQSALKAGVEKMLMLVTRKEQTEHRAASIALNVRTYGHWDEDVLAQQITEIAEIVGGDDLQATIEERTSLEPWMIHGILSADGPEPADEDLAYPPADPLRELPLFYPPDQYRELTDALADIEGPLGTKGPLETVYAAVMKAAEALA